MVGAFLWILNQNYLSSASVTAFVHKKIGHGPDSRVKSSDKRNFIDKFFQRAYDGLNDDVFSQNSNEH